MRKKILFSAVILFGATLLGFTGAELYFRATRIHINLWSATGRAPSKNSMAQWAYLDAFSAYRAKPASYLDAGKTVNSQGFISTPEIQPAKAPGEIRIAFFGESSTAGTGVNLPDAQTWPWKTIDMVRRAAPDRKITFINAASGGYTSFESYGRFWSRVRFFRPDIIVLYHGINEFYYFNHEKMDRIEEWRTLEDGSWSFDFNSRIKIYEPLWIDHIIRYSQFLTRIRLLLTRKARGEVPIERERSAIRGFNPRGVEVWRDNLRLFRETAFMLGIEMIVCKQMTLVTPANKNPQQDIFLTALHGFGYDDHLRAFAAVNQVIEDEIPADRIIDLTPFSGEKRFLHDHIHPTEEGTTKIAEVVSAKLIQHIQGRY